MPPFAHSPRMPAMSFTEILGFLAKVIQAVEGMRDGLASKGIDADKILATLRAVHERMISLNEKQETLKRETKATTAELVAVTREGYAQASGVLDTLIAAAGKTSPNAKNLGRMRVDVLRSRQSRKRPGTKPPPD